MTQILVLHPDPAVAARRFRSRQLHSKLLVEALQLIGGALRSYGVADTSKLLYDTPNKKHLCCLWVGAARAHLRWAVRHARELHDIYNHCLRKRCAKCGAFASTPHASLPYLEHAEHLVATNDLPDAMPESVDADAFYDLVEATRVKQGPKARAKAGEVLRAYADLPHGCSCVALAIDGTYQASPGCVVRNDHGDVCGTTTYHEYHKRKTPEYASPAESGCPWLATDFDPTYKDARTAAMCACVVTKKRRAPPAADRGTAAA